MNQGAKDAFHAFFKLHVGDENAVLFLTDLLDTISAWDDIHDGDPCESTRTDRAFSNLMHRIPVNPYYQAFAPQLHAMMTMAYLKWQVANRYESEQRSLEKACMLRAELYGIIHYVILTLHGLDKAEEIGTLVWDFYGETPDDLRRECNA